MLRISVFLNSDSIVLLFLSILHDMVCLPLAILMFECYVSEQYSLASALWNYKYAGIHESDAFFGASSAVAGKYEKATPSQIAALSRSFPAHP